MDVEEEASDDGSEPEERSEIEDPLQKMELKKLTLMANMFCQDLLICMDIFLHKEKEQLNTYLNFGWLMELQP